MKLKPIPDQVIVHARPQTSTNNLLGVSINVCEAYAVDSTNTSRNVSAQEWAGRNGTSHVVEDNKGFTLTILSLTVRAQGGRAYKVVDQLNRMFDLREDSLLEAIANVGILPGGILPGYWLWSLQGSEMKLIREGSAKHQELLSKSSAEALTPTPNPVVGLAYTDKRGKSTFLYVGNKDGKQLWMEVHNYSHKGGWWGYTVNEVKSKKVYGQGFELYPGKSYKYTIGRFIDGLKKDKAEAEIRNKGYGWPQDLWYYDARITMLESML